MSGRRYSERFVYDKTGRFTHKRDGWDGRYDRNSVEAVPKMSDELRDTVRRDNAGNVVAYHTVKLEYADGRLTRVRDRRTRKTNETVYTYRYDEAGRAAGVTSSGWGFNYETTYTYDGDRMIKREQTKIGANDQPIAAAERTTMTMTIAYDASGRPTRVATEDPERKSEQLYFYDCTHDEQFDGAIAEMIHFKDRACACPDRTCGIALRDELRAWLDGLADSIAYAEPNTQQNASFGKIVIAATECIEKTFVAKPQRP